MNDNDMLESLALRLVQGMEELGLTSWYFEGWALAYIGDVHGSRRTHHEQEPESGTGPAASVEAGDDGGDVVRRTNVGKSKAFRRSLIDKKAAKAKALLRRPWSRPRRGRVRRRGWR